MKNQGPELQLESTLPNERTAFLSIPGSEAGLRGQVLSQHWPWEC